MAIAPANYTGSVLAPGEALVIDRGYNGADEVWRWSPATSEGETVVHSDNGTLIDAVDIAIGIDDIYLVEQGDTNGGPNPGRIYVLNADGSLTQLSTSEPIIDPVGIAVDPLTGDLFVADMAGGRVVRVNPNTGAVRDMFAGFTTLYWASVDVTPNGLRIIITDLGADKIYTFTRLPGS